MTHPIDPLVAAVVAHLDDNLREAFEERAAIIEYEAQLPRAEAEYSALLSLLQRHPDALLGVTALRGELNGTKQWLVTTNLDGAYRHLAELGATGIAVVDLAEVVAKDCGGLALIIKMTR